MSFTYDLTTAVADDLIISQIRRLIGDTVDTAGPLPNEQNFADVEVTFFYDQEGSHIYRAAAAAFEALSAAWSAHNGRQRLGPRDIEFKQAEMYAARAERLRGQYGYAADDTADDFYSGFSIEIRPAT